MYHPFSGTISTITSTTITTTSTATTTTIATTTTTTTITTTLTTSHCGVGTFSDCVNEWCLQQGLTKPQHTKCEYVTNNGNTCENPVIKYGSVEGGIPRENSGNNYEKWCEQLGGMYDGHTLGTREGYCVFGQIGNDDYLWHWSDCSDGYWYNQTLDLFQERSDYVTSITCDNGKLIHSSNIFQK